MANKINLYTDGGCRGNGKAKNIGGYGIILHAEGTDYFKEVRKAVRNTTNNKMELGSVVRGLEMLTSNSVVTVYTDSAYVVNAINRNWLTGWQRRGWVTASNTPVANQDLWVRLDNLMKRHHVEFVKVKGHSNHKGNNRCDRLANLAMDAHQFEEYEEVVDHIIEEHETDLW